MAVSKMPMTEREYEDWFEKYLGDIESLDKTRFKSPLLNIPKPFNGKKWIVFHVIVLISSVVLSFVLAYISSICGKWFYEWFSNAFLNLSLGLVASLILLLYTNHRDRNVAFYSDIIPLLKTRYENMREAYRDFTNKISRYHQQNDYENCYIALKANSNTCIVIADFFKFLITVLPYKPKSIDIDFDYLDKGIHAIVDADHKMRTEFSKQSIISDETVKACNNANYIGQHLLFTLQKLIIEFEQMLYGIKYTKKLITDEEKRNIEYEKQIMGNNKD